MSLVEPVWPATRRNCQRQDACDVLKSCQLQDPILGFPTEADRLDTDVSLFMVGGILNQIQGDREVAIAYAS